MANSVYVGIAFPLRPDPNTGEFPAKVQDEELIAESIRQLVGTVTGERVMRRELGMNAYQYVFATMNEALEDGLRLTIVNLISKYEKRVYLSGIDVRTKDSTITLSVSYVVRLTGEEATVAVQLL